MKDIQFFERSNLQKDFDKNPQKLAVSHLLPTLRPNLIIYIDLSNF